MHIWDSYRTQTVLGHTINSATSSETGAETQPGGESSSYTILWTAEREQVGDSYTEHTRILNNFTATFPAGFSAGAGTADDVEIGNLTAVSQTGSFSVTATLHATEMGEPDIDEETNDSGNTSTVDTATYGINYRTTLTSTFDSTRNMTGFVEKSTTFWTVYLGTVLTQGTTTTDILSNATTTTSVNGVPETVTYETLLTSAFTNTLTVVETTSVADSVRLEIGVVASTEETDWLWTHTAGLLTAITAPDLSTWHLTDIASSVSESTVLWPVWLTASVPFYTYATAPTASSTVGTIQTFTLESLTDTGDSDATVVDFASSKWPWREDEVTFTAWTITGSTTTIGSETILVGSTVTKLAWASPYVSCQEVGTSDQSASVTGTTHLLSTSRIWTTSEKSYALLQYLRSSSTSDSGAAGAGASTILQAYGASQAMTTLDQIAFDAHQFSYESLSNRLTNFNPLHTEIVFVSPQSLDSDAGTAAGTNLEFAGGSVFYPFSASVRENLAVAVPYDTTAYDPASSISYTYRWSIAPDGTGATLSLTKMDSDETPTATSGVFDEVGAGSAVGVEQGGRVVGGFLPAIGAESATFYPGLFWVTSIAPGGGSTTTFTTRTGRETSALEAGMVVDSLVPASITAAHTFFSTGTDHLDFNSARDMSTGFLRNETRDHAAL